MTVTDTFKLFSLQVGIIMEANCLEEMLQMYYTPSPACLGAFYYARFVWVNCRGLGRSGRLLGFCAIPDKG